MQGCSPPRLVETEGLTVFLLRMKVPAALCPHAELQEVPPTSARQRNLQAPAEVGTRRMPSVAAAALCMPVQTISRRAMQVMVDMVMDRLDSIAQEATSVLKLELKDTLTVNVINTAAKLVCRDGKD